MLFKCTEMKWATDVKVQLHSIVVCLCHFADTAWREYVVPIQSDWRRTVNKSGSSDPAQLILLLWRGLPLELDYLKAICDEGSCMFDRYL